MNKLSLSSRTNLLIWNGMATRQVSGGDIYIKKLIECSSIKFNVVLPKYAADILETKSAEYYIVDQQSAVGVSKLLWLYLKRICRSIAWLIHKRMTYQVSVAASPFMHDILPVIFSKSERKAVVFFHIIPKRKATTLSSFMRFAIARIEQKVSLILIRLFFDTVLAGNDIVVSELKNRVKDKKYIIADAGIDTERMDLAFAQKDKNLAVFVGRLMTQKGILDLVDIVKEISSIRPEFRLVVIGDGPDRRQIEEKIKLENVDSIELLGFVDNKTKYALMRQAQFFIFPSYEEGWGIALAEALYCGCLAFTYEIKHYRSIFKDYPVYVDMGDSAALAASVLKNYHKPIKNDQVLFMSRYDHPKVIDQVAQRLVGYLE